MPSERFIYSPELFSAQGTGFTAHSQDHAAEQVNPGIHLRCFADARLGLPGTCGGNIISVAPLQYPKSIADQRDLSLFENTDVYPVLKRSVNTMVERVRPISASKGSIRYAFEKKAQHMYGTDNPLAVTCRADAANAERTAYAQAVLDPFIRNRRTGDDTWMKCSACAVDVTVKAYRTPLQLSLRAGNNKRVIVRGYDWKGRLVAEDWIGEIKAGLGRVSVKRRAVLRAPDIAYIDVTGNIKRDPAAPELHLVPGVADLAHNGVSVKIPSVIGTQTVTLPAQPGLNQNPALEVEDIWWVHTDDYLKQRSVTCRENGQNTVMDFWRKSDIGVISPMMVAQYLNAPYVYAPFPANRVPAFNDISAHFGPNSDFGRFVTEVSRCRTAYDMYNKKWTSADGKQSLTYLMLIGLAALDALISRLFGMYFFGDRDMPAAGDYKVVWKHPPFFTPQSLDMAGVTARENWLTDQSLASLVMHADTLTDKPLPAVESITVSAQMTPISNQDMLLASEATVTNTVSTAYPCVDAIAYEVFRGTRATAAAPFVYTKINAEPGVAQNAAFPDLTYPERTDTPGTVRVSDMSRITFADPVRLSYRAKPYDMFRRCGAQKDSAELLAHPPLYKPEPPTNTAALADAGNPDVLLTMKFFDPSVSDDRFAAPATAVELVFYRQEEGGTQENPLMNRNFNGEVIEVDFVNNSTVWKTTRLSWQRQNNIVTLVPGALANPAANAGTITLQHESVTIADVASMTHTVVRTVTRTAALAAGKHAWRVRFRSKAVDRSGRPLYSSEIWVKAEIEIAPAPPIPAQPPIHVIPLSTYPDKCGTAFYHLDLSPYMQRDGRYANMYLARAAVLDPGIAARNDTDAVNSIAACFHDKRKFFSLNNTAPVLFTAANRFYSVQVPASAGECYAVVVVGVAPGPKFEEGAWENAGYAVFKTPCREAVPSLSLKEQTASFAARAGSLRAVFAVGLDTANDANPPMVQVTKQDLTVQAPAVRVADVRGVRSAAADGSISYDLVFEDATLAPWHAYKLFFRLLYHSPRYGRYIVTDNVMPLMFVCPGDPAHSPMREPVLDDHGRRFTVRIAAGEYAFTLVRLADTVHETITGNITGSAIVCPDPAVAARVSVHNAGGELELVCQPPETQLSGGATRYLFTLKAGGSTWSARATGA